MECTHRTDHCHPVWRRNNTFEAFCRPSLTMSSVSSLKCASVSASVFVLVRCLESFSASIAAVRGLKMLLVIGSFCYHSCQVVTLAPHFLCRPQVPGPSALQVEHKESCCVCLGSWDSLALCSSQCLLWQLPLWTGSPLLHMSEQQSVCLGLLPGILRFTSVT